MSSSFTPAAHPLSAAAKRNIRRAHRRHLLDMRQDALPDADRAPNHSNGPDVISLMPTPDSLGQPDTEASDLAGLPGIGDNLIWLLNSTGVYTYAELADCDPQRLGHALGSVGQIIDVSVWIDIARADQSAVFEQIAV